MGDGNMATQSTSLIAVSSYVEYDNISTTAVNESDSNGRDPAQLWVSPVPDWDTAIPIWGAAWPFHHYFFASAFTLLTIVTLFLLRSSVGDKRKRYRQGQGRVRSPRGRRAGGRARSLLPPPVFSLIAFASFIRALCLFADPYHSTKTLPTWLARVFGGLPFTSYLCAYQLLFLALHSALRIEIGTLSWLSKRWLIFGTVAFFMLLNTGVDLILVLAVKLRELLLVCIAANCLWIGLLVFEFTTNALRLKKRIDDSKAMLNSPPPGRTLSALAASGLTAAGPVSPKQVAEATEDTDPKRNFGSTMRRFKRRLTSTTSLFRRSQQIEKTVRLQRHILHTTLVLLVSLLAYLGFLFYYFLGTADVASFENLIEPWTWYTVSTCYRAVEIFLSVTILYMLSKSNQKKRHSSDTADGGVFGRRSDVDSSQANGAALSVRKYSGTENLDTSSTHELPAALYYFRRNTMLITAL